MLEALRQALLDWLANVPWTMGPAEFLSLGMLLLAPVIVLAPDPINRSLTMAMLGVLLGLISATDVDTGVLRDLWGFYVDEELPLGPALVIYGFLLPRIAVFATRPDMQRQSAWRTVYDGLVMPHTLPALLLMRQPWLPARWVLPVLAALMGTLCVYWDVLPTQYPWLCMAALVAGLCALWLNLPWPPLLTGLVLQHTLENGLRRALLLSDGDWTVFLQRPISAALLLLTVLVVSASLIMRSQLRRSRQA